jgi:hypothetical protein
MSTKHTIAKQTLDTHPHSFIGLEALTHIWGGSTAVAAEDRGKQRCALPCRAMGFLGLQGYVAYRRCGSAVWR